MSQMNRIATVLAKNAKGAGVTVAQIAKLARVSKDTVYKRVSDLRGEGYNIYSNYRTVKGERKLFYRMAG